MQLLVYGLLGIVLGFFGSIYTQSTCDFAVAEVAVGEYDNTFKLHFGMWKYSPLDSVFQNYAYCYRYDHEYASEAPSIVRICTFMSLIAGCFSLAVLWVYLILGSANVIFWKLAIRLLLFSGVFQCTSFFFFIGSLCRENECVMGPGAVVSIFTTMTWFVLAYQMHTNTPGLAMLPEISEGQAASRTTPLVSLEMPEYSSKQIKGSWKGIPFLSSFQREDDRVVSLATLAKRSKIRSAMNSGRRHERADSDDSSSYDEMTEDGSYYPPRLDESEDGIV